MTKSIHSYKDVQDVLDAALAQGGGDYTLSSRGKAINWRQRAYEFRQLKLEEAAEQKKRLGFVPATPYDNVKMTVRDCTVRIERRQVEGELAPLPFPAPPTDMSVLPVEPEDELLLEATRLLNEKGEKDDEQ